MKLVLESPHVRALCRDGAFYAFPVEQHRPLLEAWKAGRAFYEADDAWGEPVCVKLADIVGVTLRTEAGLALCAEEEAERKRRETFDGAV